MSFVLETMYEVHSMPLYLVSDCLTCLSLIRHHSRHITPSQTKGPQRVTFLSGRIRLDPLYFNFENAIHIIHEWPRS
jgi:hypothetical protein